MYYVIIVYLTTVAILLCRIIVGAPMGTFPGGLPLSDPGQPAENQTGLVYSCPVQPGVCEGVQGDTSITAADIDANMATVQRDLPNSGPVIEGRLFDQARKSGLCQTSTNIVGFDRLLASISGYCQTCGYSYQNESTI